MEHSSWKIKVQERNVFNGRGKLAVPLPATSKRDLPWWFHHSPRAGPELFRFRNWENWICQHWGKISQSGPQSYWPSSHGRCVNQNAILLIYSKKSNRPGDQTNILCHTPSLPVLKSAWEVKLSSEDSQASLGSELQEGAGLLIGMLHKSDASLSTKRYS